MVSAATMRGGGQSSLLREMGRGCLFSGRTRRPCLLQQKPAPGLTDTPAWVTSVGGRPHRLAEPMSTAGGARARQTSDLRRCGQLSSAPMVAALDTVE